MFNRVTLLPVIETSEGLPARHFDHPKLGRGVLRGIQDEGFGNMHADFYTVEPLTGETSVVAGVILTEDHAKITKDRTAKAIVKRAAELVMEAGRPIW
ncbi:hypothetical protein BVY00_00240 [bacterium G20]|nr:hypothetical protein BVY00_00240 [bacterium G20]